MSWFAKSPFGPDEDAAEHMVELLSAEAEKSGTPLTDLDKEILSNGSSPEQVPGDLRQKAKKLITSLYLAEPWDEFERDPKSFGNSLQWAGDSRYPNIVALAEELAIEMRGTAFSPPQGWRLAKDRLQLIGCGLLVVLLMFAIVIGAGFMFGWK